LFETQGAGDFAVLNADDASCVEYARRTRSQVVWFSTKRAISPGLYADDERIYYDGVPFMIQDKQNVQTFANVDLVIDADGYGHPDSKVTKYNRMTDSTVYPFVQWRGIKLFLPNPHEQAGHFDQPQMTFEMVFGLTPTAGDHEMKTKPIVIIIA
jgi:hypothetical protein